MAYLDVLLLLAVVVAFTSAATVEDVESVGPAECRLNTGGAGVCREVSACPIVLRYADRYRPNFCPRLGRTAIVCCPLDEVVVPKHVVDISPPAVDFLCGSGSRLTKRQIRPWEVDNVYHINVGEPAPERAWPWMALLGAQGAGGEVDWICSGVLINPYWVLTAAHCFERSVTVVRLGEHDYDDNQDDGQDFTLSQVVQHPDYHDPVAYHDLALIRLDREPSIGFTIAPVCLPWGRAIDVDLVNMEVMLAGWGRTQDGGSPSSLLQEVAVTVFPTSRCDEGYRTLPESTYKTSWPNGIGDESLCAGDSKGEGRDSCSGDSGGPMMYQDDGPGRRWVLAGIISKGHGCGLNEFPGLYVDIRQPQYLAWIRSVAFAGK